ncbi:helix-turn-helix domain-containing protein [Methylomagnum ishizawai]|uniref:Transcriptional regulator, contains XRE-family HTH domain n=1 Tax=Methylomagnum ishizawai TaxID=1760988 RepID=A0A1Y6CWF5_9GAMM|nr:helix-turn-helix transcriptional regulator [Methylomagnum ishizawai]BBL74153.1 hypothetical protein MishRS11D_12510 [Methylomagnum ishizawai]SMF94586.1 Transcriptional regulator, contains XRE-family HTH domain [Methylomagnum ishizawai]
MDETTIIGLRLKAARDAKNWTLQEVCDRVPGLKPSTLNGYELGKSEAKVSTYKRLAKVLEVSEAYVLNCDEDLLNERERQIIQAFRQTNEQGKRTIWNVAESQPQPGRTPETTETPANAA